MPMLHIPSDIFLADLIAPRDENSCCADVRRQCPVIYTSMGQVRTAIDQVVSCNPDHTQALVVRVEETSSGNALVAEVRRRWPAVPLMAPICSMKKAGREWGPAAFHYVDELVRCANGRDELLRSLCSFGLDGEANA